ncbi:MAG: N-acetylmuramoyl-L-alanine amidase [Bacteroidetes bacterium]|nr:N-acetylmuramoyl-L-alanine amidase [Bacteroidota bacterium]
MVKQFLKYSLLLFALIAITAVDNAPAHLKYVAQAGDGIYAIMRKYQLDQANCNLQYFFKINDLHNDDALQKNQVYQLPITVHTFDGKSIRSSVNTENLKLATAIQDYNDQMFKNGLKNEDFRKNKELWVPYSYTNCELKSIDKPVLTQGQFPIFGEKYADIDPIDNALKDHVFYIISGHGGPDPGAMATINGKEVSEDEYAYDICLRLARNLLEHGAIAYLIIRDPNDGIRDEPFLECDNDETCWKDEAIPLNQNQRLKQRAKAVNALYAEYKNQGKKQLCIPIHIDSRNEETRVDMFFYHHPKSTTGKAVAETLRKTIKDKYDYYNPWRGYNGDVSSRDLFMLRETHPTTVYLELGNIQNPKDQDRFTIVSNRQAIADWLTDGLLEVAN